MSELVKNILMWLFILVTMFTVFSNFSGDSKSEVISYSEFLSQVESDQVLSVQFLNDNYTIKGKTVNGDKFETVKPPFLQDNLSEILLENKSDPLVQDNSSNQGIEYATDSYKENEEEEVKKESGEKQE